MASFDTSIFAIADFLEPVTLQKIHPSTGTATDYANVTGLPRNHKETVISPEGVQMVVEKTTWHLSAADLPSGVRPDRGDRVVSVSDVWVGTYALDSGTLLANGTRWECEVAYKMQSVA